MTELPVWNGPSSLEIWTQSLAYASLASSLLAALGAVLGKQWLVHFKSSRFGRGCLAERCQRRQQKIVGLGSWYFEPILEFLPVLLQLSLLFFAIFLIANIWTIDHILGAILICATAIGAIFYTGTMVIAVLSPHSPFESWSSTLIAGYLSSLVVWSRKTLSFRGGFKTLKIPKFCTLWGIKKTRFQRNYGSDLESHPPVQDWQPQYNSPLLLLTPSFNSLAKAHAIKWLTETSTDAEVLNLAISKIASVEWPSNGIDTTELRRWLFSRRKLSCRTTARDWKAQVGDLVCLRAICHLALYSRQHEDAFIDVRAAPEIKNIALALSDTMEIPSDDASTLMVLASFSGWFKPPIPTHLTSACDIRWISHVLPYYIRFASSSHNPFGVVSTYFNILERCLLQGDTTTISNALLSLAILLKIPLNQDYLGQVDKSTLGENQTKTISLIFHSLAKAQFVEGLLPLFDTYLLYHSKIILIMANYIGSVNPDHSLDGISHDTIASAFRQLFFYCRCINASQETILSKEYAIESNSIPRAVVKIAVYLARFGGGNSVNIPTLLADFQLDDPPQCLIDHIAQLSNTPEDLRCFEWPLLFGCMDWGNTNIASNSYLDALVKLLQSEVPVVRHATLWAMSRLKNQLISLQDTSLISVVSVALHAATLPSRLSLGEKGLQDHKALPYNPLCGEEWTNILGLETFPILSYLELVEALSGGKLWRHHLLRAGHFQNTMDVAQGIDSMISMSLQSSLRYRFTVLKTMNRFLDDSEVKADLSFVETHKYFQELVLTGWEILTKIVGFMTFPIHESGIGYEQAIQWIAVLYESISIFTSTTQHELVTNGRTMDISEVRLYDIKMVYRRLEYYYKLQGAEAGGSPLSIVGQLAEDLLPRVATLMAQLQMEVEIQNIAGEALTEYML